MKICVLGAGVIGLTSAYALSKAGHDVVIVDRQQAAGREASFGNGAQLSYSYVAPFASPALLRDLPRMLLARDGPVRMRPTLDLDDLRWCVSFLMSCRTDREKQTIAAQLALSSLSKIETGRLVEELDLDFGWQRAGKLVLYRDQSAFRMACNSLSTASAQALSADECLAKEPALSIDARELAGGIWTADDEVGDCAVFCRELARHLSMRRGVTWHMGHAIEGVDVRNNCLRAIRTSGAAIEADLFLVCLGSGSRSFARQLGFQLPILPIKGYSLTLNAAGPLLPLSVSVTDLDHKIVFAPLLSDGMQRIRIAGIADMAGSDPRLDGARLGVLRARARVTLRGMSDAAVPDRDCWAGLRPATPDSRPIIGPAPIDGVFLNTGHGGLGWTLACGSANLARQLIDKETPDVDAACFSFYR